MIDFSRPVRFRGKHAAYAQYLSKERMTKRENGVNIFDRIMDAYLVSILVGLKFNKTAPVDESDIDASEVFGDFPQYKGKKISSSDINAETIHASQELLNYIYRIAMLNEQKRNLSDEEKIANAFKSDSNQEKIDQNIELMNSYARGGLEVLYSRFEGLAGDENAIMAAQLELSDELGGYE